MLIPMEVLSICKCILISEYLSMAINFNHFKTCVNWFLLISRHRTSHVCISTSPKKCTKHLEFSIVLFNVTQSVFLTILTNVLLQAHQVRLAASALLVFFFWHAAVHRSSNAKTSVPKLVRTPSERVRFERFLLVVLVLMWWKLVSH